LVLVKFTTKETVKPFVGKNFNVNIDTLLRVKFMLLSSTKPVNVVSFSWQAAEDFREVLVEGIVKYLRERKIGIGNVR
jgi:hypothetical protein